jgi:hypothetical protein
MEREREGPNWTIRQFMENAHCPLERGLFACLFAVGFLTWGLIILGFVLSIIDLFRYGIGYWIN